MRARYKPVTPDQQIRDLRKQLKALEKEEPSPERAPRLAAFARSAHRARQLNMAMHTAQQCLDEDPDAPDILVAAYDLGDDADPEEALRSWSDLDDLGRYLGRDDLREIADGHIRTRARAWVRGADEAEARHRLRALTSMFDQAFADGIRDDLA